MRCLFCILFSVIIYGLYAQERKIGNSDRPESEITAAVNPADDKNMIVAVINDFRLNQGINSARLAVYYTLDQGERWQKSEYDGSVDDFGTLPFIGDPVVSFDSEGNAYLISVLWFSTVDGIETRLYLATSTDRGQTWRSILLHRGNNIVYDKPWLITDLAPDSPYHNSSYFSYVRAEGIPDTRFEIFLQSRSGEGTISPPVRVHQKEYRVVQSPSLSSDADGRIVVSFVANDEGNNGLYAAISENGGRSFLPEVKIADINMYYSNFQPLDPIPKFGLARLYICPHVRADKSGGIYNNRLYATWTDIEEGHNDYGLDIYLSHSDDHGASWSAAQVVNQDGLTNNHQYYSTLEIDRGGRLLMGWYDRRADSRNLETDYYFSWSADGGITFEEELKLTSQAADFSKIGSKNNNFGIGEYTAIAHGKDFALPLWSDGRTNNGNINVYMTKIAFQQTTPAIQLTRHIDQFAHLSQPVPNPAANFTTLKLELLEPSPVGYKVQSLAGKMLRSWPAVTLNRGTHALTLDLQGLAKGMYLCTVETRWGEISWPVAIQK